MEKNDPSTLDADYQQDVRGDYTDIPVAELPKSFWSRIWPVFACGAGLFSDGYLQSVRYKRVKFFKNIPNNIHYRSLVPAQPYSGRFTVLPSRTPQLEQT